MKENQFKKFNLICNKCQSNEVNIYLDNGLKGFKGDVFIECQNCKEKEHIKHHWIVYYL